MRYTLLLMLTLCCWNAGQAQLINYTLISIDTQYYAQQDSGARERIIDNNSTFWEVFRGSKYSINPPRFHQQILLQRSIQEDCLQSISHSITVDSLNKTVRWRSTLERGTCGAMNARHFVIAIRRPPPDYEILFDTAWVPASQTTDLKAVEVPLNPISCKLDYLAGSSFHPLPAIITTDSLYLSYYLGDALKCTSPIDFDSDIVLAHTYGGDCHMQLKPHSFFDPVTNTLVLDVYNVYGGCRAGGRTPLALVVPKPKNENYNVLFQEVQVEDWAEYWSYIR